MDATEILCSLLEERGVEWREHEAPAAECIAFFDGSGWHDCWESVGGEVNVTFSMTPEQAIAATLGWGMLTADDVRDLIERHSDASGGNGRDFHNGAYVAIADELNATLGQGTCHNEDGWCSECQHFLHVGFEWCPWCGRKVVEPTTNAVDAEVSYG